MIKYHEPAAQWQIFGIADFESYCEQMLVEGLFNQWIPDDVANAYEVAEYMMAHAWYCYPLYDEAFSKLLRIVEMAVKIRCKELGIPLESDIINKRTNLPNPKSFNTLIKDLLIAEPAKAQIKEQLHRLRSIRNKFMHADSHQFGSVVVQGSTAIRSGVAVLNEIFMPEAKLKLFTEHCTHKIQETKSFHHGSYVLEHNHKRILAEGVLVARAIYADNVWLYCLLVFPVVTNMEELAKRYDHPAPFSFIVTDIVMAEDVITASEYDTGKQIQISITRNPENLATIHKFKEERDKSTSQQLHAIAPAYSFKTGQEIIMFKYRWLWRVV